MIATCSWAAHFYNDQGSLLQKPQLPGGVGEEEKRQPRPTSQFLLISIDSANWHGNEADLAPIP